MTPAAHVQMFVGVAIAIGGSAQLSQSLTSNVMDKLWHSKY
jgi:hypothetical protein